jgi:hypothetical protein
MLGEQAGRRRRSSPTNVIRILVDGVERGRLNPAEQSRISFSAEEDAEIIEVKTTDSSGELLLATHLLSSFGKDEKAATIRLEGGQVLSLSITRRAVDANGKSDFLIEFGCRETDPRRAARLWWRRLNHRFSARSLWGSARISPVYIVAGSVLVICLAGYVAYVRLTSRQTSGPPQTSVVQTPTPETRTSVNDNGANKAPVNATTRTPDRTASQSERVVKRDRPSAAKAPATGHTSPDEDVADLTRSGGVAPNLTLREIKKIYLEIRGVGFAELRGHLVESLNSSGVVAVTTGTDEADAALKIVVSQSGPLIEASAQLVNARGTVLWPARRYSGEAGKVASEIIKDLLSAINIARAGH